MGWLQRLRIDKFLLVLILVVLTASILPAEGGVKVFFEYLTTAAIALLFFMHGAKLSREAITAGMGHWRLHLVVFASTFILFPLLGIGMSLLSPVVLTPTLYLGFLYLCALPATVQSAIAYTSMAGGNVAAAICSASASSILGVFLSPILVGLLMHTQGGETDTLHAIGSIIMQLMVPFVIGHLSRPLIAGWVDRHRKLINITDRSSILLVVYVAFSEAVVQGIWGQINGWSLLAVVGCSMVLLAIVLVVNTLAARKLGFNTADEITIVFCGSKKSLANGIPMANVLFPAAAVGAMVLPLMIFHQIQLMVCAALAQRYAKRLHKEQNTPNQ
ncbi:bile acid:sodium symporter [Pectobacterium aroidearum]|jgi:sodium/bile acid cotransporter 7|uniref:Bile acid:sodium symporter n=2 Tax=Pectobacterium TaxID=122277 RepID=A0AAW3ST58_9GAMM|nr:MULTISPECIES: bile acid:sodium symporter family protein [Pectobacterium]ACT13075.1 Bile acid:sodium symporter [Pectobacterium carotovorum subsp. carotovorum PC1]MBA0203174.1 bile acid:sodium symporter [Pectobacterium aroidearum]MBA5198248.1 bile acid:sodium symporter [Pectobacterium aroidearum]MBA5203710.1 bile acid:sodium symporter [Pectobacterium aroidearum]MBA5227248.1 bile acid:sodium symporter [Pectobacterium aroidearum]